MLALLKQFLKNEKGQALPIVLAVLAIGGLVIVPTLNYATSVLNSTRMLEDKERGAYAAGAGVENVIWCLGHGVGEVENLTENINHMVVNIETVEKGTYTFYIGGLYAPGDKSDYFSINGTLSWVEGNQYQYVITVTRTAEAGKQTIHLAEVGARIPVGYTYSANSTTRSDNITAGNPVKTQDSQQAYLLRWLWVGSNRPTLNKTGDAFTITFYITGTGSPEGEYAWVVADPSSIGLVSEITGTWYQITATAVRPADNRTTARIVADIINKGGTIQILSWRFSN